MLLRSAVGCSARVLKGIASRDGDKALQGRDFAHGRARVPVPSFAINIPLYLEEFIDQSLLTCAATVAGRILEIVLSGFP